VGTTKRSRKTRCYKRAIRSIDRYLAKKAVLLSTIAALGGGCGVQENAGDGPHLGTVETVAKPFERTKKEVWAKTDMNVRTPPIFPLQAKKESWTCTKENEIQPENKLLLYDYNGGWGRYSIRKISPGQCTKFSIEVSEYTLFLKRINTVNYNKKEYEINVMGPEGLRSAILSPGKHLRISNGITISLARNGDKQDTFVHIHKINDIRNLKVELENCEMAGTSPSCKRFRERISWLLQNIRSSLGIDIGDCTRHLVIKYDPEMTFSGAHAGLFMNTGWVIGGNQYFSSSVSPNPDIDHSNATTAHELMHVVRDCANSSGNSEGHHLFFIPSLIEVLKRTGIPHSIHDFVVTNWVHSINKDPSIIMKSALARRCIALQTYFLSKRYVGLSESEKANLVKQFHVAMMNDPRMLRESKANEAMRDITCSFVSEPNCATILKTNCPK
jgi:hypothetical protein